MHYISIESLQQIVDETIKYKVDREAVMYIFSFESYPKLVDGKRGYVINRSGTYRGLGQFSKYTWDAVCRQGLPYPYTLVGNPHADVLATFMLLQDSKRFHRNTFGTGFNKKIAYLYHNQGAPAGASYLRTGVLVEPRQSAKALEMFEGINRDNFKDL